MTQLRAYLSEPLLEQIPHLADLQRYLQQLSLMELPAMKRDLILEQVCVCVCVGGGGGGGVSLPSVHDL